MQIGKYSFFEKIVKKDYNNELEKVLERKKYTSDVKNLLLEIMYKTEDAYKDYKEVKQDVEEQEEYIQKIISTIKDKCNSIKTVMIGSDEAKILGSRTFIVNKEDKEIICYPIERKLLYCISKINKKDIIIKDKHEIICNTISDMLNIGNCINTVEPLRSFNGWSWSIIKREIENIECNLIYQNLRILLGNKFLIDWVENEEYLIDYYDVMNEKLEELYGKINQERLSELLSKISILFEININESYKDKIYKQREEINRKYELISNKKKYVEYLTREKQNIQDRIKQIETLKSNKKDLQEEYNKRNAELPLEKKIFSIRVLGQMLMEEREKLKQELEQKNILLRPDSYVIEKEKVEKNREKLDFVENDYEKYIIEFQKIFLECFEIIVARANTKEEIKKIIYDFRYYSKIPLNIDETINESKELADRIKDIENKILVKSIENKVINENISLDVFKYIMNSSIISLENMYVTVKNNKKNIVIQFSEENNSEYEEKLEISKEDVNENNFFGSNKNGYRIKLFS